MPPTNRHPTSSSSAPGPSAPAAVVGAIPARYAAQRLPGKPLRRLAGQPLIEHVYHRVRQARGLSRVVVLTDDQRIADAVAGFGGEWEMTPSDCTSGTDRIAHAAWAWDAGAVVNVQGDEPLIDPEAIAAVAYHLRTHPDDPMVTLAAPAKGSEHQDPEVVKVVVDRRGYALYFSRAPIPYLRRPEAPVLIHVGIYGYQRQALLELAALDPTPLERSESLEQLRALENGIPIRVLEVAGAEPGVDTEEDLARVAAILEQSGGAFRSQPA